jgi:UDP-N-acetylmuramoyl-L-alanyl-D-glutamate--2,6-diaminopimelate ligase
MGAIAAELADLPLVTTDNPRSERPEDIVAEILAGAAPGTLEVELDRRTAIERAIGTAVAGDVVVIAGKGHEQGQEIDGVKHPFDDREVARAALRKTRTAS